MGVIAVDPSSPYSGGERLGDMDRAWRVTPSTKGVFIRSARDARAPGAVCRAVFATPCVSSTLAGYDVVLVETVGVGQDELEIANTAHTTLVVAAPGLGDEVQAVKAGIRECADVFAVNKADREGADATVRDLELMIALGNESIRTLSRSAGHRTHTAADAHVPASAGPSAATGEAPWTPPIVKCVATQGDGVDALAAALDRHRSWLQGTAVGQARWRDRLAREVRESLREALIEAAVQELGTRLDEIAAQVQSRSVDPYTAIEELVESFRRRGKVLSTGDSKPFRSAATRPTRSTYSSKCRWAVS